MTRQLQHFEIEDLLGVYAAGAIDDASERATVEAHLDRCAACRGELADHRAMLAELTPDAAAAGDATWDAIRAAISAPPVSTPADDAAFATSAAETGGGAVVIPFPRRRLLAIASPLAAAAAAALVTFAVMQGDGGLGSPAIDVPLRAQAQTVSVSGSVALYAPHTHSGRLVIELSSIPDPPAGHHYEVWVLRPGDGVEMEAVGAFTPANGRARLVLGLPGPDTYVAVDISVQKDGGPPEHSGESVAGASLQ
jgi:Anti-sigma-K factor rskA/Putative zinc-finger